MLAVKNGDTLKCVESALFAVSLETDDIDPMVSHNVLYKIIMYSSHINNLNYFIAHFCAGVFSL